MTTLFHDPVFAPIDIDLHLERIGGGNETEVYCTDDRRFVVKVKGEQKGTVQAMVAEARKLRQAARRFGTVMGKCHRIPNHFLIAADIFGHAQILAIQPFHEDATTLCNLDYAALSPSERLHLAGQVLHIMKRALGSYWKCGWMPDLYGRLSQSSADRLEKNRWYMFPHRLWSFLVERNLLRANNLMLTTEASPRVILVDYDPVTRGKLYQQVYYAVRALLFTRDALLLAVMVLTGWVPK